MREQTRGAPGGDGLTSTTSGRRLLGPLSGARERRLVADAAVQGPGGPGGPGRFAPLTARVMRSDDPRRRGPVKAAPGEPVSMSIPLAGVRDGIREVRWPVGLLPGDHVLSVYHFQFLPAEWVD